MKNRTEVLINGVVNMMTDEQMGNMYVDITVQEREALRLAVAREKGLPEPELYSDLSPELYEGIEKELDTVVELQERMAKGQKLIDECSKAISANKWAGYIYNAWAKKYDEDKCYKILADPRNQITIKWIERRAKFLALKNGLKEQCKAIAKEVPSVWPKYFQLAEGTEDEGYDSRAHKKDCPEIDNRMLSSDEAFFEGHMEEQEELFAYNR